MVPEESGASQVLNLGAIGTVRGVFASGLFFAGSLLGEVGALFCEDFSVLSEGGLSSPESEEDLNHFFIRMCLSWKY